MAGIKDAVRSFTSGEISQTRKNLGMCRKQLPRLSDWDEQIRTELYILLYERIGRDGLARWSDFLRQVNTNYDGHPQKPAILCAAEQVFAKVTGIKVSVRTRTSGKTK